MCCVKIFISYQSPVIYVSSRNCFREYYNIDKVGYMSVIHVSGKKTCLVHVRAIKVRETRAKRLPIFLCLITLLVGTFFFAESDRISD